MVKPRIKWKVGDIFLVPQSDGRSSLGQIIAVEPEVLNSVVCAFYDLRFDDGLPEPFPTRLPKDDLISILFTTRDLLDRGVWRVVGHSSPQNLDAFPQLGELRRNKFVGAKVVGSGNVAKFLNSYWGLFPWDAFLDPGYFDKLLISADRKPARLTYKVEES